MLALDERVSRNSRWHGSRARDHEGLGLPCDAASARADARAASNPLMLALMCRVLEDQARGFPAARVEFYDRCVRGLLRE